MRNLFLSLVLVNLLFLAWHFWVDPASPVEAMTDNSGLTLFNDRQGPAPRPAPAGPTSASPAATALPAGACFWLGPLPDSTAAQQAGRTLADRGVEAAPIARDVQQWLGYWVQVSGFDSAAAAETARQRLVAGGLADALLMQDGPQPLISLGVFRDRSGADRVSNAARQLGFDVGMRDRYRPAVEHWLLVRPRADQALAPADLSLVGGQILRSEPAPCDGPGSAAAPRDPDAPGSGAGTAVSGVPE